MMENKYDMIDRIQYHQKYSGKKVRHTPGDDDSMNDQLPSPPMIHLKQISNPPPTKKDYEMINMSESLPNSDTNTLVKVNTQLHGNQNQINTKLALLNETIEVIIQADRKSDEPQLNNTNNLNYSNEQKIQDLTLVNQRGDKLENELKIDELQNDNDNEIEYEEEEDGQNKNETNNKKKKMDEYSTRRSLHTSSSLQLEDYFNQDADKKKKEQMDRIISDLSRFKSYFVKFRMSLFFEFFFYHALFVIFLGPFANPIISWFGKGLPRNLLFWGNNDGFRYQTMFYIMSLSAIVLYLYYPTHYIFFQSEFIYLFLGMVYRIYTIVTKYATFDPFKVEAIKHHVFKPKELQSDFFLFDWREQQDRIIYEEIYFAQRAYDIDPSWFYLEFIVNPDQETKDKFSKNNFILSQFHKSKDQSFQPQPINITNKDTDTFYIYGIIKSIVDAFQENNKFLIKHVKTISLIYSLIRCLIPTIYKLADDDLEYIKHSQWYEWIISFNIAYLTYKLYFYTCWIILQGIIDMKRKIYMMEQMAFMISPRKHRSIDVDKLFPTINIFKSSNLKAWQLMRHVCQEYGKRYDIRVQANFSGLILIIIVAVVILSLNYADVIQLEPSFTIVIVLETMCILIIFVQILYYGAKINEQFDLHDAILTYNKSIVMDIYRMRRRYFCDQFKTTNYLYSKAIQKIKDEVAMLKLQQPCEYLKEVVYSYDTHIDELKFDQRQNPFKIGSLKITNGLLESGIIGVISIGVAIIGKFLQNRLED